MFLRQPMIKLLPAWTKTFVNVKIIWTPAFYLRKQAENIIQKAYFPMPSSKLLKESDGKTGLGFRGGAVVESLPAGAGDMGSSPGLGGSHMPRSDWAREPQLLSVRVWSLCSATREAVVTRGPRTAMKSGPHLPQLEKALAQKRRPNTAIKK